MAATSATSATTTAGPEYYQTLEKDSDEEEDYYCDNSAYRLWYGPSIERYGDSGLGESLIGLTIEFTFHCAGGSSCTGTVTDFTDEKGHNDLVFDVSWTCGSDSGGLYGGNNNNNENGKNQNNSKLFIKGGSFPSKLHSDEVCKWHIWAQQKESHEIWGGLWVKEYGTLNKKIVDLFDATKLVDFHSPDKQWGEPAPLFAFYDDDEDGRYVTLSRLNDPDAPSEAYGGTLQSYPLSFLLMMICVSWERYGDDTIKLPVVFLPRDERVYAQHDILCRRVTGKGGKYNGETEAVDGVAHELMEHAVALKTAKEDWRTAYEFALAFILCMSEDFEEGCVHSWTTYGDDIHAKLAICARIIHALGVILLEQCPAEDATVAISKRDRGWIEQHLPKTNFMKFISNFKEDFDHDKYPTGRKFWEQMETLHWTSPW